MFLNRTLAGNLKKVYVCTIEKSQKGVNMLDQKSKKGAGSIVMKRKIYQQLLDWKEKRNGEVAPFLDF